MRGSLFVGDVVHLMQMAIDCAQVPVDQRLPVLLCRLCQLTDSSNATAFELTQPTSSQPFRLRYLASFGPTYDHANDLAPLLIPWSFALAELRPGNVLLRSRCELANSTVASRSAVGTRATDGDCRSVYGFQRLTASHNFTGLALRRSGQLPAFAERELTVLEAALRWLPPQASAGEVGWDAAIPPRRREVLRALSDGHSEKEIAALLGLSIHTVHCHIKRLHRELHVNTRAELLLLIRRNAVIQDGTTKGQT